VRKQYNFWPSECGVDAWDVDRLIELSRELPVIDVPIASISEVDSTYWFDYGSQRPTVRSVAEHARLIAEVDLSWPIILSVDGRVMDGMHRVARAIVDGRESVRAVRLTEHVEPDYRDRRPEDLPY
jgi:hypothetical protein